MTALQVSDPAAGRRPTTAPARTRSPVTVIVPTFNRAAFIGECLSALLDQTLPPERVIVVDDGSSDDTPQVVAGFGAAVEYIRKENGGKSTALNLALPLVHTEFVWIFDDDDVAYRWAIERHLALHREAGDLGFTFGFHDIGASGPAGRIEVTRFGTPPLVFSRSISEQRLNLLRYCSFTLNSCIIKTELFKRGTRFREQLHRSQDYACLIELSQKTTFAYVGCPTYIVRQHSGLRGAATSLHSHSDRRRAWLKYDRLLAELVIAPLPLSAFAQQASDGATTMRSMKLGRASVMASKCHVDRMAADLIDAVASDPEAPLTEQERACCEQMVDHEYFVAALNAMPRDFRPVLAMRRHAAGRQVLAALLVGFYRTLRSRFAALDWSTRRTLAGWVLALMPFARHRSAK